LNAELVSGIDYFLQLTQFQQALDKSSFVITGEGSIDNQTLQGKAPFGVAKMAKRLELPVIGLAGIVPIKKDKEIERYFDVLLAIDNGPSTLDDAILATTINLERTTRQLGNLIACCRPFQANMW